MININLQLNTMDNLSDSLRGELDSMVSTDSLQLITNTFYLRHLSTPDVSNIELSKHVALLELENERLRIDLENMRIDFDAQIAANQGLKDKITELYVEMQTLLQNKQKLQDTLTDTNNRLSIAETSAKWYQSQVHILMASKKSLQVEIDTYQGILKQRQQAIMDININYKKLNTEYTELVQQYQREKQEMQNAMKDLQLYIQSINMQDTSHGNSESSPTDISMVLEASEDDLQNTKAELKTLEQRLLGNEIARMSMENTLSKQHILILSMEENMQKCEMEKNETVNFLRKTQFEIQKLKSENLKLQTSLFTSKQEQSQVEDAISHLRIQLTKMISQYKLLKSKNIEAEKKLNTMQDLANENKYLRALSHNTNNVLLKKLREQKTKIKNLEQKFYCKQMNSQLSNMRNKTEHSIHECLKQVLSRNKDLQDQLKSVTRIADESIDEGYGDSNSINTSLVLLDISSPSSINSVLFNNIADILARSKDFGLPMEEELNALRSKMEILCSWCER